MQKAEVKSILVSYFYVQKKPAILTQFPDIFLDSGAYSAMNSKKTINLQEYINFIKQYQQYITHYASLDVIGNAEETYKNYRKMKESGLNPIPCFHIGSDFKWLELLCKETNFIALGGMVPHSKNVILLHSWLKKCFSIIPPNTKVHGFGMTNPLLLKIFPFYSADSTSWISGEQYGNHYVFSKGKIRGGKISKRATRKTQEYKITTMHNIIQWKKFSDNLEAKKI
jgi:hypothetical protein